MKFENLQENKFTKREIYAPDMTKIATTKVSCI